MTCGIFFYHFIGTETVVYTYISIDLLVSSSMNVSLRGHDRMSVQSVHITNKVVSSNPTHGEVHSIQHYLIKFIGGFLRFSPLIKLTPTL